MTDLELVEASIENCKKVMADRDRMERLLSHKDFKEVIMQGYVADEATRLTGLLGDPNTNIDQNGVVSDLHAIASFQRYLRKIRTEGELAERELATHMETLDAIRAEGDQ